jgi:hypothetical protein
MGVAWGSPLQYTIVIHLTMNKARQRQSCINEPWLTVDTCSLMKSWDFGINKIIDKGFNMGLSAYSTLIILG